MKKGLIGIGIVGFIAFGSWSLYHYLYRNFDYELGAPSLKVENGKFVIVQPITFISKIKLTANFKGYSGRSYYKGTLIGNSRMNEFTIAPDRTAQTNIYIEVSENVGSLIGENISTPLEFLKVIQNGVLEKGSLQLAVGKQTVSIPLRQKIYFL